MTSFDLWAFTISEKHVCLYICAWAIVFLFLRLGKTYYLFSSMWNFCGQSHHLSSIISTCFTALPWWSRRCIYSTSLVCSPNRYFSSLEKWLISLQHFPIKIWYFSLQLLKFAVFRNQPNNLDDFLWLVGKNDFCKAREFIFANDFFSLILYTLDICEWAIWIVFRFLRLGNFIFIISVPRATINSV